MRNANVKLASRRKDMGMAGYLSDGDLMRYRMLRDQGADRYVKPKHPLRYACKTPGDKVIEIIAAMLLTLMFPVLLSYVVHVMTGLVN